MTAPVPSRRAFQGLTRAAAAVALSLAAIGVGSPIQAATPAAAPTAVVTATPKVFSAAIAYRIDRGATAVTGQQCTLTNPAKVKSTVACDPTPNPTSTSSVTRYSLTLPSLTKAGTYTFSVRFTVVGGTKASASQAFTIKPGPAVRLSVTGVADQDFDCTAASYCGGGSTFGPDFPRQLAKVTARDQYGNVAKGYSGTVRMERRDGDFPDGIYPNDAKLNKGVGYFPFVAPQMPGAAFSTECPAANWSLDVLVRFYDKDDPSIHGCKKIQIRYLITPPAPSFPVTTDADCPSGCNRTHDGFVIDPGTPIKAYPIDSTDPADDDTVLLVGKLVDGDWFSQVIEVNPLTITVDGGDQGLSVDACPDCPDSRLLATMSGPLIESPTVIQLIDTGVFMQNAIVKPAGFGEPRTNVIYTQVRRLCNESYGSKVTMIDVLLTEDLPKCLGFATPPGSPSRRGR